MDGLHHFFQLKEDLLKEKAKIVWYQHKQGFYQPGKTIAMINCELKDIQQEIDLNLNKFYDGKETAFMEKYFSGQAFVSFSDPEAKQQVLEKYQKKSFFQKRPKISYHNQNIEIHDAPDPLDVYWDNLHINNQFIRIIISYFVILIVVGSAFASIYFYTDNIGKIIDIYKESQIFRFAVTFVISVIINIFNMGILILGKKLSQFERLHTKTEYNISAMRKITLGQAIITVSIIYIIDIILHQKNSNSFGQTFKQGGLAYTATVVIIGNTAIPFLIEFFDLKSLFRRYKQWRVRRKAQLYENIDFDIIYRYSVAIKTMYVCAFYTSIIPMALVWGLLSLILTFWIDKYNLLRRRSVLSNMSSNLAHQMVGILEFCLVLFALGNFATHVYQIQDTDKSNFYKSFSIFGVYAAVAHMLLPTKVIAKKLFPSPENPPNEDTYELSKLQFVTDYQRENPATGEASRQQHMKRIMEIKKKQDERSNVHHLTLGSIQSIEKIQKIQEMYNMKLSKKPNQRQENQSERVLLKTQESDLEDQNIQQVSSKEPSRVNLEQY